MRSLHWPMKFGLQGGLMVVRRRLALLKILGRVLLVAALGSAVMSVLRLNDIWYATRDVVGTMRQRARVAHISGWKLVDIHHTGLHAQSVNSSMVEAQESMLKAILRNGSNTVN